MRIYAGRGGGFSIGCLMFGGELGIQRYNLRMFIGAGKITSFSISFDFV